MLDDIKERLRGANPVKAVAEQYGVKLRRNGTALVGLCPLHDEKTASFTVYPTTQSFFCFGCGKGGDVFKLVELAERVDFQEALHLLANRARIELPTWAPEERRVVRKAHREHDELVKEVESYHRALVPSLEGYKQLMERGVLPESIKRFQLGWDGASSMVTLPVWRFGRPVSIVRWGAKKEPKYLFPSGPKPLVGCDYLGVEDCLVVEGYFDWVSLVQDGFSACCTLGKLSRNELSQLRCSPSTSLVIMFDGDDAGVRDADKLAEELFPRARVSRLPDGEDPNSLAVKLGGTFRAEVERLVGASKNLLDLRLEAVAVLLECERPEYAKGHIFPLVARLERLERERYERLLKDLLKVRISTVREAISGSLPPETAQEPREVPKEVLEKGRRFADGVGERPLDKVVEAARQAGVGGEDDNVRLIYLALTSRLLERPVSVVVKGVSSGGKSYTVEKTLSFFPPVAFWARTGLSPKALAYSEEDFQHRTLVIFEAEGLGEEGAYLLRSLLSEGRILYETVESTREGLRSRVIEKPGPTNCILTTTRVALHPENETRLLSLSVDDSKEQTRHVLLLTASRAKKLDMAPWRAFQAWLAREPVDVAIPFAQVLARMIPPIAVRLRRDFPALLTLIQAHALLCGPRRHRDERGAIVATLDDYEAVREVVLPVISEGVMASVSKTLRETVQAVEDLTRASRATTNKAVAEKLKLDKSTASRRIKEALSKDYLVNEEDRRGRPAQLKLGDLHVEDVKLLPEASDIASLLDRDATATAQPLEDSGAESGEERLRTPGERVATMQPTGTLAGPRLQSRYDRSRNRSEVETASSEDHRSEQLGGCDDSRGTRSKEDIETDNDGLIPLEDIE